eukprot:2966858-Pyramimonas_sp.AAC.1
MTQARVREDANPTRPVTALLGPLEAVALLRKSCPAYFALMVPSAPPLSSMSSPATNRLRPR